MLKWTGIVSLVTGGAGLFGFDRLAHSVSGQRQVDKFTDKALPALIKDLGGAIDWLAKEVEKPSFVEKVEGIVGMIGSLVGAFGGMLGGLARFVRWIGVASPGAVDFASGTQPGSGRGGENALTGGGRSASSGFHKMMGRTIAATFDHGGPHYRELRELFHVLHMAYYEGKKLFDDLLDEGEQ